MLLTCSMIRKSGHRFSEKIMLNRFYCVVLAPKPAGRRAHLSGDQLIPLPGGGENRLVGVSPMARGPGRFGVKADAGGGSQQLRNGLSDGAARY
jgi:hypothetical protein